MFLINLIYLVHIVDIFKINVMSYKMLSLQNSYGILWEPIGICIEKYRFMEESTGINLGVYGIISRIHIENHRYRDPYMGNPHRKLWVPELPYGKFI